MIETKKTEQIEIIQKDNTIILNKEDAKKLYESLRDFLGYDKKTLKSEFTDIEDILEKYKRAQEQEVKQGDNTWPIRRPHFPKTAPWTL